MRWKLRPELMAFVLGTVLKGLVLAWSEYSHSLVARDALLVDRPAVLAAEAFLAATQRGIAPSAWLVAAYDSVLALVFGLELALITLAVRVSFRHAANRPKSHSYRREK